VPNKAFPVSGDFAESASKMSKAETATVPKTPALRITVVAFVSFAALKK
jgi:hypothetical protein